MLKKSCKHGKIFTLVFLVIVFVVSFAIGAMEVKGAEFEKSSQVINIDEIPPSWASWQNLKIHGCEFFINQVFLALEHIESGPEWAIEYVTTYLDYVVQYQWSPRRVRTGAFVNVESRTFNALPGAYMSDSQVFASVFVHEAVHVRQYQEHLEVENPSHDFYSTYADRARLEREAYEIQIMFLEEIGAHEIIIWPMRMMMERVSCEEWHRGFWNT
jgi:hypothetical protein